VQLKRGYALVRDEQGNLLSRKAQAENAAALSIRFDDGVFDVPAIPAGAPGVAEQRRPAPKRRRKATDDAQQGLFD
jgi:exodeoxyribonuclease VII large subunit